MCVCVSVCASISAAGSREQESERDGGRGEEKCITTKNVYNSEKKRDFFMCKDSFSSLPAPSPSLHFHTSLGKWKKEMPTRALKAHFLDVFLHPLFRRESEK